jgi:hypothetical protein
LQENFSITDKISIKIKLFTNFYSKVVHLFFTIFVRLLQNLVELAAATLATYLLYLPYLPNLFNTSDTGGAQFDKRAMSAAVFQ